MVLLESRRFYPTSQDGRKLHVDERFGVGYWNRRVTHSTILEEDDSTDKRLIYTHYTNNGRQTYYFCQDGNAC
jgi:hypothetical protein